MSLETWKNEYYPIPAGKLRKDSDLACVEHSLRKWRGLRPAVLDEHKLSRADNTIEDYENGCGISIDAYSCALCAKHLHLHTPATWTEADACMTCPLFQLRGGVPCDDDDEDDESDSEEFSPYSQFILFGDPEAMIELLERAKEFVATQAVGDACLP